MGARVAAKEATADGIMWTFAPMADLVRDPRWGRVSEAPGEDPYLATKNVRSPCTRFPGRQPV